MKKLLLIGLVMVMLSVVLVGCGGCADEPNDVLPPYENGDTNDDVTNNEEPADYSYLVGTWQGYAIAVTQTLVITDVQGDMITFYFENISSIAPEFDTTSEEMTLPIVNNQITATNEIMNDAGESFSQEVILTFYDDYIEWRIGGLDLDDDFWWTLTRN